MNIRSSTLAAAFGLSALLAFSGPALAQQDTAQAGMRMRMRIHTDSAMTGQHMQMQGARGMRGHMRGGHTGPHAYLAVKDQLELSEEQVASLEKIHEDHEPLMQAQMERMKAHREAMQAARAANDWDAIERAIDEGAELQAGMARGILNVERQSREVLTDAQREKYDTWREGVEVLRQHRMHMRGQRSGHSMQMRHRQHRTTPPPQR
jgi:hypothetical protein